jgi:hypothetical protein
MAKGHVGDQDVAAIDEKSTRPRSRFAWPPLGGAGGIEMDLLRSSWKKIATGLVLVGALGAGGASAYQRYTADCCYPGSPCCTGGACCMRNRHPAPAQQ